MKRRELLNKHFCKNKIQISQTRQQKQAIFTFLHYKSMGSISCHSNQSSYPIKIKNTNFRSPYPWMLHIKFGFDWPSGFREEDLWKCERTHARTHARRLDYHTISSPWAFGSGELITVYLLWSWHLLNELRPCHTEAKIPRCRLAFYFEKGFLFVWCIALHPFQHLMFPHDHSCWLGRKAINQSNKN